MKAPMVSGSSRKDEGFEFGSAAGRKLLLCLAGVGSPIVMWRARPENGGDGQIHKVVVEVKPSHRACHDRIAVIASVAGDDALLLWLADEVVVVPDQLGVGFVGVRAGGAVEDALHRLVSEAGRGHFDKAVGEADQLIRGVAGVGVEVGQLMGLAGDGVGDFAAAVADVHAVESGKSRR